MARISPISLGFALAFVLVIQVVHSQDKCRTGCQGAPSQVFKYAVGTTYKYDLDSKIQITLSSAEGQQTGTEIKAKVLLTQQPDCNQVLRIEHLQIIGADGKDYKDIDDIKRPVVLNFHDGNVQDHFCIEPGDTQNSLNVKRAVASLFQANLKRTHETDVFGVCPTDISSHNEGPTLVIDKSRNLNKCSHRENIKQDYLATAFNLNSEIKSSPILDSSYTSKQKIKNGILEYAFVTENYLFTPFSNGDKGAKAVVHTKLHLTGTGKDNPAVKCSVPRSIIFENPHVVQNPKSNVNSILAAVKETVKAFDTTVHENSANEFIDLIKVLRANRKDDLLAVYNQIRAGAGFPDKEIAKKVFLDALLRSVSGDTIEVGVELLKNKELSEAEEKLVYLGFSFARHVSEGTIKSAAALLNQQKLPREAYLGIGTLVNRFCREHSCKDVEAVHVIVQKLLAKLGDGKASNREDENDTIFTLKALANVHHLDDSVSPKIIAIAQDKKAPNRLRVAALETYLSDPCKDKLRDSAMSILKDIQQDSEVRIKAYLAVAQCPNAKIGNGIKALLEHEPSYQVGGFIISHIKNLRSSANPDKLLAKQHLGFLNLPKHFPIDFRKWSFNGEFSYNIDTLGIGNSIETNTIFSQNSFLPRSTSLNLTTEVFGHTFNFLELEARQENFDQVLEHYFGPAGVLREGSLQDLINNGEKQYEQLKQKFNQRVEQVLRAKRDVSKGEIDHIKKQIQIKTPALNKDLDLDLSLKVFGSELAFISWYDTTQKFSSDAVIDKIVQKITEGVNKAKNFDESIVSNLLWLDAELAYPTSLGFPLRLAIEGTSAIKVKAAGSVDIRALLDVKQQTLAKLTVIPSANIEVAGRLTLDALHVENGLKVRTTLFTATGGEISVDRFPNQKGFDIKFGFPLEKQTLLSASHDIVFHTREHASLEKNVPLKFAQNKDFTVCLDQLSPLIGLTFCADFNGPNVAGKQVPVLPFPLAGDSHLAVTIDREDLSNYHIRHDFFNEPGKFGGKYIMESINKQNQRKVAFEAELFLAPEIFVKLALSSPIKSVSAEGRIVSTPNEKALTAKLLHDKQEYYGKAGFLVQHEGQRFIYKPILEYKTPKDQGVQVSPYRVEGQIIYERGQKESKYILENVRLIAPDVRPITIAGYVGSEGGYAVFVDLTATNGAQSGSLKGRLQVSPQFKINAELQNTINPKYNFNVKNEVSISKDHHELDINFLLIHGHDLSSKVNKLSFVSKNTYKFKNERDYEVATKNKLSYPLHAINIVLEYEQHPKSLEYEVVYEHKEVKFGSELEAVIDKKSKGDWNVEFEVWGFGNKVELKSDKIEGAEQCKINNVLVVNGKTVELSGELRHVIKPQDIKLGADLVLKVPTHNTPFNIGFGFILNSAQLDTFQKVSSGNHVFLDAFLKANKAGNANGAIKVEFKDLINVNGQVKANKGSGTGQIAVELPPIKRSVKADTSFTLAEPTYNVIVNVFPYFNDHPDRKITYSSHNTITQQNIDSKNFIDVFGEKLEANVKGTKEGEWNKGVVNGEAEVIFPNQRYLLGKLHRDVKEEGGIINADGHISLENRKNKNVAGQKFDLKAKYKDFDYGKQLFDVEYNLAVDDAKGHTLNSDFAVLRLPNGDKYKTEVRAKVYGSVIKEPVEGVLRAEYKDFVGNYEANAKWGNVVNAKVHGKYDAAGESRPYSGDVNVEVTSQTQAFKVFKASASGSLKEPRNPHDTIEMSGSGNVFIEGNNPTPIDIKLHGAFKSGPKQGTDPKLGYGFVDAEVDGSYGSKRWKVNAAASHDDVTTTVVGKFHGPTGKNTDLSIKVVQPKDKRNQIKGDILLQHDGKKWSLNGDVIASEITPAIHLKYTCPEGQIKEIAAKVTKSNDKQFAGDIKLYAQKSNFLFEAGVDANVENVDDFVIKVTANSPSLNLNKIVFEAHNKPAKTGAGRRIQVTAKSAGKNILTGSSTYTAHEENGKLIVEGSGSFKVKEETKTANFKYIRQNLSYEKNGESGIEVSFDAGWGNKAIDAELRITNKQFRILNSYCEEKKECAHVELDSKTSVREGHDFKNELEIAIDLRKLGLSHEFGLKSVTSKTGYLLDHTVDVHFQSQEHSKYQYSIYVHPKQAGASLTTPKRIIALEAVADYPESLARGGKVQGEVAFYLDKKNKPNHKTSLLAVANVDRQAGLVVDGSVSLSDPVLQRPISSKFTARRIPNSQLGAEFKGEIDIFDNPQDKIEIVATTDSTLNKDGFKMKNVFVFKTKKFNINIDNTEEAVLTTKPGEVYYVNGLYYNVGQSKYDNVVKVKVSSTEGIAYVKVANHDVFNLHSAVKRLGDNHYEIDSELSGYGTNPAASKLVIKDWNTASLSVFRKANPADKLQVNSAVKFGQIAKIDASVVSGGAAKDLFHASVKLDDKDFLKPEYKINAQNIQEIGYKIRDDFITHFKGLKDLSEKVWSAIIAELGQFSKFVEQTTFRFKPLTEYYKQEAQKIKEEILADKSLSNLVELVRSIFGVFIHQTSEAIEKFSEAIEHFVKTFQEIFGKAIETFQKDIVPRLKEITSSLIELGTHIFEAVSDVFLHIVAKVATVLEGLQPEIQKIAGIFAEIAKQISEFFGRWYHNLREAVEKNFKEFSEEVKSLPIVQEFGRLWKKYVVSALPSKKALVFAFKDLLNTLRELAPTPEWKQVFVLISEYVDKKVTDKPCDDAVEIDKIVQAAIEATRHLIANFLETGDLPELSHFELPQLSTVWSKLPKLAAIRFSPLAYIVSNDLAGYAEFLLSLLSHPRYWIPPFPLNAIIVQGQHIFTFDGKHFTFPGKCNYLLVGDAVHNRFTLAGTYENGFLTALTLADETNSVTYKKNGHATYNNAPTELPKRSPDLKLAVYRQYNVAVLKSENGIEVICSDNLQACAVEVSGYYHGHLRGLLGNGNNEPYDDLIQPTGKIVPTEGAFVNSYKLDQKCPDVKPSDNKVHHPAPSCSKLFSEESELRLCYPFVHPKNYLHACEHGVAAGVKDTEHSIAIGYVAACQIRNIPVSVPREFLKCVNSEKPHNYGETFSATTPGKLADIVILVDTSKYNEPVYKELVQPLAQQLTNELHTKGVNDIEYHLITYGGQENRWPSHVTVGGKLTYKGKLPNVKFTEPRPEKFLTATCPHLNTFLKVVQNIKHDIDLVIGNHLEAETYAEGLKYPFRAEAIKSIIAVTSKPCEVGSLLPLQILSSLFYKNDEINLNLITPTKYLDVKDAKHTKDVAGFNDNAVFTISGAKKNPNGSPELHKYLVYNDYCIDFTLKNGGNVFITDNFLEAKGPHRKQFVQAASHNIAAQLSGIERHIECECKHYGPYEARNICNVVNIKDKRGLKNGKP